MSVYTVLEPPEAAGSAAERAERIVFIRDGFSWGAFLLTPAWMLYRRLWLAFLGYVVLVVALQVGLRFVGVGDGGHILAGALIALLIGFEAATLRRWNLVRRGWRERGSVIGDGLEDAERRFFDGWVAERRGPSGSAPPMLRAPARPDVIGLFPEPGAHR
jgi:hypothetical protein